MIIRDAFAWIILDKKIQMYFSYLNNIKSGTHTDTENKPAKLIRHPI